jgi:nicotinate-nucleotide adenylyltransferase
MSLRILYGGTFDPVHTGHLAVAAMARDVFNADIALIPAADPPHRPDTAASAAQRAHMLRLALRGLRGCSVDERELRRDGPSYTIDTLREVRAEIGDGAALAWLVGADAFRALASWRHWRELFAQAHFIVAVRPGHDVDVLDEPLQSACEGRWTANAGALGQTAAGLLYRLALPLRPESASAIRAGLAQGSRDHDHWLPPAVAAYIRAQGLYRAQAL